VKPKVSVNFGFISKIKPFLSMKTRALDGYKIESQILTYSLLNYPQFSSLFPLLK